MLEFLTGWKGVQLVKINTLLHNKDYGSTDVIIWERSRPSLAGAQSRFTFCRHGEKRDYVWRSGTSTSACLLILFPLTQLSVTAASPGKHESPDAEIYIYDKSHGDVLYTPSMTAVFKPKPKPAECSTLKAQSSSFTSERRATPPKDKTPSPVSPNQGSTKLHLHFANSTDPALFYNVYERLRNPTESKADSRS